MTAVSAHAAPCCALRRVAARVQPRTPPCRRAAACSAAAPSQWRLAGEGLAPSFVELACGIEQLWSSHAGMAHAAPLPVDARFVTVDGGLEAERIRIENRFVTTPLFRKCHLELAVGAAGLNVLHCVMYPWAAHDLPLFSVDMVGFGVRLLGRCRACCAVRNSASASALTRPACASRA